MLLALSTFLLAATPVAAQTPDNQEPGHNHRHVERMPDVGSPAALESQLAFREWNAKVVHDLQTPFILDYQFTAQIFTSNASGQIPVEGTVEGGGQIVARSLREFQHQMNIEVAAPNQPTQDFAVDLLLDGTTMSAYMGSSQLPELDQGMRVFSKQEIVENAYREYISSAPALLRSAVMEEGMPQAMEPFLSKVMELTTDIPADLGRNLHPAGYWNYGLRYWTCRDFGMQDGVVTATLTIDFQKGSKLREIADSLLEAMIAGGAVDEEELAQIDQLIPLLTSLVDDARLVARFDERSGIPLGLEVDFNFDIRDVMPDIDPVFRLQISYQGALALPTDASGLTFRAQPEAAQNMDIAPFIQMGLGYLRNLAQDQSAEEDLAF